MTNFEKIKSMDTVELSKFINQNSDCLECLAYNICDDFPYLNCEEIIEEWLKMDMED